MTFINRLLAHRRATPEEALRAFDQLEPVSLDFMLGRWRGYEISTGHRMDGMLSAAEWYGKLFVSPEEVHPLLHYLYGRRAVYAVNPGLIPLHWKPPKSITLGRMLVNLGKPLLQTQRGRARLRMTTYRGKTTGTMIYDRQPIFDHFAKIDDRRMFGLMDLKGSSQPFAFVLERDESPALRVLLDDQ